MTLGYSKQFPDFPAKILSGEKIHTIREDKSRRWREGMKIQHVTGNRTKERKQFAEGVCTGVQDIVIVFQGLVIKRINVEGYSIPVERWRMLAYNDGMEWHEFQAYFRGCANLGIFIGRIIHWTDKRY